MVDLKKKTAVVTGASSGLGKAVAELLAEQSAKVFALARSVDKVELPSSVVKIPLNIRDLKSIDDAFAAIDKETQTIDILVNCAGRALTKKFEETTREEIMDVFGVNLKGNIYIALEVYKRMIPEKNGYIINVSSTSGIKARDMETIYCASKWGLRGFTESLRLEGHAHGIRVSGVYPGGMNTNFWKENREKASGYMDPKLIAEQIVQLLTIEPTVTPSELILERT